MRRRKVETMRLAFLAASVAVAALASGPVWAAPKPQPDASADHAATTSTAAVAAHVDASFTPAAAFTVTAPAHADPARTYSHPSDAILAADLDYLVRRAHSELTSPSGDQT